MPRLAQSIAAATAFAAAWCPAPSASAADPALIPAPIQLTASAEPAVECVEGLQVVLMPAAGAQPVAQLDGVAERLSDGLLQLAGIHARLIPAGAPAFDATATAIQLRIDPVLALPGAPWAAEEGYRLAAGGTRIELSARTAHGLFNGVQTLLQLLTVPGDGRAQVPALTVADAPRFR